MTVGPIPARLDSVKFVTNRFKGGLAVDFFKEKTELLSNVKIGDLITVHINTRVNESKTQPGRYFNSITGWRLEA